MLRIGCESCGDVNAVPIARGYPSQDGMDATHRREIVLGGCIVSEDDPSFACLSCGWQFGAPSDLAEATSLPAVEAALNALFDHRDVERVPSEAITLRLPGVLFTAWWQIRWVFAADAGGDRLEVYGASRLVEHIHARIDHDGHVTSLPVMDRQEYGVLRTSLEQELREKGLFPPGL